MITYLLDTLVNSIKTSLINKLGLDPSTEVDLDDFPQLIDDIPILDVEELTVTENGTYTGTDGVTYNPVNVNLPLGSKSVTANGTYTASDDSLQGYSSVTVDIDDTDLYRDTTDSTYESVKTLSNCGAFPMLSLKVGIEPIQGGSGDPSPTNIRPISGWSGANVTVSPTTDAEDGTTYTIQFKDGDNPLTVYGGTLDVVSGVLTVDRAMVDLGTVTWTKYNVAEGTLYRAFIDTIKRTNTPADLPNIVCSHYPVKSQTNRAEKTISQPTNNSAVDIIDSTYADATTFKSAVSGVQLVYELATPTTIQLTPTQVKSLLGTNNLWANSGDVGDVRYFKRAEL